MQATVKILGEDYAIECADCDQRRLEDLAKALDARLQGFSGDTQRYAAACADITWAYRRSAGHQRGARARPLRDRAAHRHAGRGST